MDETESKIASTSDSTNADLREQVDALRHMMVSILVLTLIISGTLSIYLMRERRFTKSELENLRPQAAGIISEYEKNTGPLMDNFVKQVTEYGRTHPDFAPIMNKYGLKPQTAASTLPGTSAPAPAIPPKK